MGSFFNPKPPQIIQRAAAAPATTSDKSIAEARNKRKRIQLSKSGRAGDIKTPLGGEDAQVNRPQSFGE